MDVIFRFRKEGRYLLHGFAIMPVQAHLLITPLRESTLEGCQERIRSEFAHRARMKIPGEIWQAWAFDHRVRSAQDFELQLAKIAAYPVQRGLRDYGFVHTRNLQQIDAMPASLIHAPAPQQFCVQIPDAS